MTKEYSFWTRRTPLALTLALLSATGCGNDDWGPPELRDGVSSPSRKLLERGRAGYATYCVGCHGENGDGNGPAARFLNPRPRDFRVGRIKFASVTANSLPTDEDYAAVIRHGLAGTAMPSWELVSPDELRGIVAYVRAFYPDLQTEERVPPVTIPADPFRKRPDKGIAEGERLYHGFAACYACHPAYVEKAKIAEHSAWYKLPITEFRPDLHDSVEKDSDWGAPITPPNFTRDRVKFATTRERLAQVIATGVGGTAMPSWGSGLQPEQLWGLAYYVESLVVLRDTPRAVELRQRLLDQPAWQPPPQPPATEPRPTK
jgi:mono/diheme cytochrome c family protein